MRYLMALLGVSFLGLANSASAEFRVHSCDYCYSAASFTFEAERSSLEYFPQSTGLDQVYVFNFNTGVIRFFHVERWIDDAFQPQSAGEMTDRSDEPRGMGIQSFGMHFRAEATEYPGYPSDIASIGQGIEAVYEFSQYVASGVDSSELPGIDFNSAVALLGPEGTVASLRRRALENAIRDRLGSRFSTLRFGVNDVGLRVINSKIGVGKLEPLSAFTVRFPDNTIVDVEVARILGTVEGGELIFDMEIDQDSVRGAGLGAIPRAPGEFIDFTYEGNDLTLAELASLASLYGIPVVREGEGTLSCRMVCDVADDTVTCRVSCSAN
jgi:hypothetical protein